MKKSTLSLALQIAQLIADHPEQELRKAVELLRRHGNADSLLTYLSKTHEAPAQTAQRPSRLAKSKAPQDVTSRAVLSLKESDPEKYRVLSEFDTLIRRGQLLPTHEDMRRFCERLSKDFKPKKARKETISALMTVLAEQPVRDLEELIKFAASFGIQGGTDEYQRLAHYLIKGSDDTKDAAAAPTDVPPDTVNHPRT